MSVQVVVSLQAMSSQGVVSLVLLLVLCFPPESLNHMREEMYQSKPVLLAQTGKRATTHSTIQTHHVL